jgi:outer membrane protein assembly factor BamB
MIPSHPAAPSNPRQFYIGTSGTVICLDRLTGGEYWRQAVGGIRLTLLLHAQRLYVGYGGGVAALDAQSGVGLWWRSIDAQEPISLALDPDEGGGRLIVAGLGKLYAVAAGTGEVLWHNELKGLGYSPVCLRVPGAITAQTATYPAGKNEHHAILEDAQTQG